MTNVKDKSVILTGGAGDIGKVVAQLFLTHGAKVMLVDRNEAALQDVVAALNSAAVSYCVADVTSEVDTQKYVAAALEVNGRIDVLLANAGVEGPVVPITEYEKAAFDQVMAVNVGGPFLGIKHVLPVMAASGGGSIVITSSIAGVAGASGISAYNASKHAAIGLMRSAAIEGGPLNVRVNTVNPSPVEGRMIQALEVANMPDSPEVVRAGLQAQIPMQRYAVPEDVANLMLFLASEESKFLNGGVYMVDGGMTA